MKQYRRFEPEDAARIRLPGKMMFSPDGKTLAFAVETPEKENNRISFSTWIHDEHGSRQLTYSRDALPLAWNSNEELIIQRNTEDTLPGTTALSLINIGGGEAKPFCTLPFVLSDLKKVSDDAWIACGFIHKNDPDLYLCTEQERRQKLKEKEAEKDYTVLDELPSHQDGAGMVNGRRNALFLVSFRNGLKVRRITSADISVNEYAADEKKILFTAADMHTSAHKECALLGTYSFKNGKIKMIVDQPVYRLDAPLIRNGKSYVLMTDMKEYGAKQTPVLCEVSGRKLKPVYEPAYALTNLANADLRTKYNTRNGVTDGMICTLASVEDHTELWAIDEDMKTKVLYAGAGNISSIAAGKQSLALIHSDWETPPEIFLMNIDGTGLRRITDLSEAWLKGKQLNPLRRIDYVSHGKQLHGWTVLPADYDPEKKYPGILDIHGGPRVNFGEAFSFEKQMFADHGYFAFFTNIRGSDGRGDEFADIRGRYGTEDFDDLMAFTDAVLKEFPALDEHRLCVMGLSYGGYMTSRIITKTDRFCCASIHGPVINWISMSMTSDIGPWFAPDQTGASSVFDFEQMWQTSPLRYADQVKTPALFLHGTEDYRCPVWEGMQMMQALTIRDIETRMVLFKGGSHNMHYTGAPGIKIRRLHELLDWFDRHTGK